MKVRRSLLDAICFLLLPLVFCFIAWRQSNQGAEALTRIDQYSVILVRQALPRLLRAQTEGLPTVVVNGHAMRLDDSVNLVQSEIEASRRAERNWHMVSMIALTGMVLEIASFLFGTVLLIAISMAGRRRLLFQRLMDEFEDWRWRLPWASLFQSLTIFCGLGCISAFEIVVQIIEGTGGNLLGIPLAVLTLICLLLMLCQVVVSLRRGGLDPFKSEPIQLSGRVVKEGECAGLRELVNKTAAGIGAEPPQNLAVGAGWDLFAVGAPVTISGETLSGRTLFVPEAILDWFDRDELMALIARKLWFLPAFGSEKQPVRFDPVLGQAALVDSLWGFLPMRFLARCLWDSFVPAIEASFADRTMAADAAGARVAGNQICGTALLRDAALRPATELARSPDPMGIDFNAWVERFVDDGGLSYFDPDDMIVHGLPLRTRLTELGCDGSLLLARATRPEKNGLSAELLGQTSADASLAPRRQKKLLLLAKHTSCPKKFYEAVALPAFVWTMVSLVLLVAAFFDPVADSQVLKIAFLAAGSASLLRSVLLLLRGQSPVIVINRHGLELRHRILLPWPALVDVTASMNRGMVRLTLRLRRHADGRPLRNGDQVCIQSLNLRGWIWSDALNELKLYRAGWYARREILKHGKISNTSGIKEHR